MALLDLVTAGVDPVAGMITIARVDPRPGMIPSWRSGENIPRFAVAMCPSLRPSLGGKTLPSRMERLRRSVLAASIPVTMMLTAWVGISLAHFVAEGWWLAVLIAVPLGVASIDFLTGIVHFACDRFGNASTPIVGPLLIRAFREHHLDPNQMVRHDWIETNGEPCFFAALVLAWLAVLAPSVQSGPSVTAVAVVWTIATVGAWANQVHKWAHMSSAPGLARWLQRAGLALRPSEHACHHRVPYDSGYCISTGWMNPLLDRLGLWPWLERSLRRTA